jgi:hypothetical protein
MGKVNNQINKLRTEVDIHCVGPTFGQMGEQTLQGLPH